MNPDILMFFDQKAGELALYEAFEAAVLGRWSDARITVEKTQISFRSKRIFACVSLPAGKRKSLPSGCILVTLGLSEVLASTRVFASGQIGTKRFIHHIPISDPEQIDAKLLAWLEQAHALADRHGNRLP